MVTTRSVVAQMLTSDMGHSRPGRANGKPDHVHYALESGGKFAETSGIAPGGY
jgi:hypothetical protein